MATVHIALGETMTGGGPQFPRKARATQAITSSGTSQTSTITANGGDYAHVTASGGAVFVMIDASPTAASGTGRMVTNGQTWTGGPLKDGDKVAIIDV